MIGSELKNYTWTNVMNMCMGEISDDVDKTQSSIIYDTLSPAVTALMVIVEQMRMVYYNTFISTAQGEYLEKRVEELGLTRIPATNAIRRVYVYDKEGNLTDVDLGTLITPKGSGTLLFALIEKEDVGTYKARCSTEGVVGNEYIGECECITNLTNIGNVMMTDVITSARNEETDTELRQRALESLNVKEFGGNIADYRALVGTDLPNVGQMQVYPRDFGDPILNSTVLSVVNPNGDPMTEEERTAIQEQLDPSTYPGQGHGIVPIGHHPIIVSPTEVATNFSMTITPEPGRTVSELTAAINEKISEYIDELRANWATLNLYYGYTVQALHAQVIAKVLEVEGVLNVTNVVINEVGGEVGHYDYIETKALQEIPVLGTVTLN